MTENKLPDNSCPLCSIQNIEVYLMDFSNRGEYICPNCGYFSITYMAYRLTPIFSNVEIRSKLSFYIRHNSSQQNPLFITKENYMDFLTSISLPSTLEQLNNLLLWFGDQSKCSFSTVDGNTAHLIASIGCKNQSEVIQLLDQLWSDEFIEMENPTTGPLRERPKFDSFCGHLTKKGIQKIEEIKQKNSPLNFNINDIPVELILQQTETFQIEVKGSFKLDLNRLLKGDHKKDLKKELAVDNILQEIVAFLNTKGGTILIGAVEQSKFTEAQVSYVKYSNIGFYFVLGINLENDDLDNYQQTIRNLIIEHISKELVELVEISFPEFSGFTLCKLVINKASHKWYYLDKEKFYVRNGNRTDLLSGDDADSYKKRNPR